MSTYARILAAKAERSRRYDDPAFISTEEGQRWLEARNRELAKARKQR